MAPSARASSGSRSRTSAAAAHAGVASTSRSASSALPSASVTRHGASGPASPGARSRRATRAPVRSAPPNRACRAPAISPRPPSRLMIREIIPALARAIIARIRLPWSRSISSMSGKAAAAESARLSPAEMPATAASTSISAASAPILRTAKSWTVSSIPAGARFAHGSSSSRSFPAGESAGDVRSAGGESGTAHSRPPRTM